MTTPAGGGSGWWGNIGTVVNATVTQAMVAQSQTLAAQVGTQQVKVEVETLQAFKNKVDALLHGLDGSPAAQATISRQELQPAHLGEGFGQAGDLANAYNQVHANLQQLSQTLALQIQAMSASIDMAAKGYQNADEEQRQAFQSILNQAAASSQPPAGGYSGSYARSAGSVGVATPTGTTTAPASPPAGAQGTF